MSTQTDTCINCGTTLIRQGSVTLCPKCNSEDLDESSIFLSAEEESEYTIIECPGVTLYEPGTDTVVQGVKFLDLPDDPDAFEIVDQQVYAPTHRRYRRIKKEARGRIRRCQGCQDYTIRQRRKEGPDFFIPSSKHPDRKKLKSMTHISRP